MNMAVQTSGVKIKSFGWAANRNQPQHRLKFVVTNVIFVIIINYYYYYYYYYYIIVIIIIVLLIIIIIITIIIYARDVTFLTTSTIGVIFFF